MCSSDLVEKFIADIERRNPARVAGTAVYMASNPEGTPLALLHNLKHNKVLHRRIVFLTIQVEEDARLGIEDRVTVESLDAGFWRVRARYGFMEEPNIPKLLALAPIGGGAMSGKDLWKADRAGPLIALFGYLTTVSLYGVLGISLGLLIVSRWRTALWQHAAPVNQR